MSQAPGRTLFAILLLSCAGELPVGTALAQDLATEYLGNVALFSVENEKGLQLEHGYGLIIGRQDTVLWIATAAHVLYAPGASGVKSPPLLGTVTATWLSSARKHSLAGRPIWGPGDVVFVPIEAPVTQLFLDTWLQSVLAQPPKPGERLWLVGRGGTIALAGDGFVVPSPVTVATSDPRQDGGIGIVSGEFGQSGSPIISQRGIVGMYLGKLDPAAGDVVDIEALKSAARKRNVPWQLDYNDAPDPTPGKLCIVHTGSERPRVRLIGSELLSPDSNGCVEGLRATYTVDPQDSYISCEPAQVDFSSAGTRPAALNCRVLLQGFWPEGPLGGGQFRLQSPDRWEFVGLDRSPHGRLTGEVQGPLPAVLIRGRTSTSHDFWGKLNVTKTTIRGTLTFDTGETAPLELAR